MNGGLYVCLIEIGFIYITKSSTEFYNLVAYKIAQNIEEF